MQSRAPDHVAQGAGPEFLLRSYTETPDAARAIVRDWFIRWPAAEHWTRVDRWTKLDDGRIAFTMTRLAPLTL